MSFLGNTKKKKLFTKPQPVATKLRRRVLLTATGLVSLALGALVFIAFNPTVFITPAAVCTETLAQVKEGLSNVVGVKVGELDDEMKNKFLENVGTPTAGGDSFSLYLVTNGKTAMILVVVRGCVVDYTTVIPWSNMQKLLGQGDPA